MKFGLVEILIAAAAAAVFFSAALDAADESASASVGKEVSTDTT